MSYVVAPDPEFMKHIHAMMLVCRAMDHATILTGQRKWMYPPLQGWGGDPQDIVGMNKAFVRDDLNKLYKKIVGDVKQRGTIGESMVVKLQVDYVAALERAFRTRHCSSVRAKLHAAARRRGQGSKHGIFSGNVVLWLERLLFAAHDDPFASVLPGEPTNE